jgi:DNA-binding MarR family transcriptional regulator
MCFLRFMKSQAIKEVRSFNRFYTNVIGLLDRHVYNSSYSLPEVRVMFELYHSRALGASEIITLIDIDKGYLSRILKKFEKNRLVTKIDSPTDKRAAILQLTAKGRKEFEGLNQASEKQIAGILKNLTQKECDDLISKMSGIKKLLSKSLNHE